MVFIEKHGFKLAVILILLVSIPWFAYRLFIQTPTLDERLTVIKKAPDFELTNNQGETVNMNELNGKVRLIYFFFSSCQDVCLPTSFFLSKVQDSLLDKGLQGEDAVILSITIDPTRDTPEVLQAYADQFQADSASWMFLRGSEDQVKQLAEEYGIMVIKQQDGEFTHTNSILLVDREGNLRNYYNASDEDLVPAYIVKDIQTMAKLK